MNDKYGIKGRVQKLEQRKQPKIDVGSLDQTLNLSSFDVQFSLIGHVLQKTFFTYGGAVYKSTRFQYDEAGRLIHMEEFDSAGVVVGVTELVYSQGMCSWVYREAAGTAMSRGVDEYDGEHLIVTTRCDSQNRRRTRKTFEYLEGRLVKSDSGYYLPDGALYERWLTDYDLEGRIHRTCGLKADGSPLGDGKYLYEYNDEGRKSKVWTLNEFGDDNIASSVKIYEYVNDDVGNWIERREFLLWRNDSYQSKTITTRILAYYL